MPGSDAGDEEAGQNRAEGEFGSNEGREGSVREQDRFLPIANISRIMKKALPANAKIAKDAKETVQECVSEFISFITSEASDKCQREKRKTINGDDLLWSMSTLGFEDYVEPLKIYLRKYRETECEKSSLAKQGGGEGQPQAQAQAGVKKEVPGAGAGGSMQGAPPGQPMGGGGNYMPLGSASSTGFQQ